jgi:hypothetical protein
MPESRAEWIAPPVLPLAKDLKRLRELYLAAYGQRDRHFGPGCVSPNDVTIMLYNEGSGTVLFDANNVDEAELLRELLNFAARNASCHLD